MPPVDHESGAGTRHDGTVTAAKDADDAAGADLVIHGDCAAVLPALPDGYAQLIYIDPPFNTGRAQARRTVRTVRDEDGDRTGFAGRRYRTSEVSRLSYLDVHDDYLGMLDPLLQQARRLLAASGTLYLHIDFREAHAVKLLLDDVFGARRVPQRADLGLRLRRPGPRPVAGQARHDLRLRPHTRRALLRPGRRRAHPVPVPRPRRPGEGRPRQAAHRRLVAHHRPDQRTPRRRVTRTRNPRASCAASSRRPRGRVTGCSTSSPAAARPAPSPAQLDRRFTLIDRNPEAIEVMRRRLAPGTRFEP